MKQKTYEVHQPKDKKANRKFKVDFDPTRQPSPIHKYCALTNKSVRFEDRRFKKPKHKNKESHVNYQKD